jgi:putative SOS response-associated peptidase YedK
MCFSARYQMQSALRRAIIRQQKNEIEFLKGLIKQYDELFYASAFAHPQIIVYKNEAPVDPVLSTWGLVPGWAEEPKAIWNKTLNARGETIFEKASFKKSAEEKRCLIPAVGFYEYRDFKGKKYPYYITRKDGEPLYFAGLWNDYQHRETGELISTFSIVTTRANPLMAKIHNKPKFSNEPRMPVIFPENMTDEWLKPLSRKEIQELALYQFPDSELDAWTVAPLKNEPEAIQPVHYPELEEENRGDAQLTLF